MIDPSEAHKQAKHLYIESLRMMTLEIQALLSFAEHFRSEASNNRLKQAHSLLTGELNNAERTLK